MMGTSLLSMPWAIGQAGLALGVGFMVLMAFLTLYTSYRVMKSVETIGKIDMIKSHMQLCIYSIYCFLGGVWTKDSLHLTCANQHPLACSNFFYRIRHHFCHGHYIAHVNVLHVSVIFTAHQGGVLEFSDVCKHYLGRLGEVAAVLFSVVCLLGGAIVYWVLMSNFLYNTVSFIYSECITNNVYIYLYFKFSKCLMHITLY